MKHGVVSSRKMAVNKVFCQLPSILAIGSSMSQVCVSLCHCITVCVCVEINECDSNPCLNNASCTDMHNGYQCQCLLGYVGEHCEHGEPRFVLLPSLKF